MHGNRGDGLVLSENSSMVKERWTYTSVAPKHADDAASLYVQDVDDAGRSKDDQRIGGTLLADCPRYSAHYPFYLSNTWINVAG